MEYEQRADESAEDFAARLKGLLVERDNEVGKLRARIATAIQPELVEPEAAVDEQAQFSCTEVDLDRHGAADGLEEAEAHLAESSKADQSPMVLQLLASLQSVAVYTDTPNHETNRKLWDAYAKGWGSDEEWVKRMAGHLPGDSTELHTVGDEWADAASLNAVLEEWIFSQVKAEACRVAEIGSGGGRVAAPVAQRVSELVCFDLSAEMLKAARRHVSERELSNVRFQHVDGEGEYPAEYNESFDFVYSFDVFVHLDLHQMRRTLRNMRRILRPGGYCFVSFANLLAPDGWRRFVRQSRYTVGGFYFVSPDIARCLLTRGGFEVCRVSAPASGNTYLNRDLLVLARRPAEAPAGAAVAHGAATQASI
mmetsp:Transcript_153670/g.294443  ORF Transcript_153670/g.294443 Transcript_153670/m.294443 type:complete len:367 (-) Transcript_153670:64-1164(-)